MLQRDSAARLTSRAVKLFDLPIATRGLSRSSPVLGSALPGAGFDSDNPGDDLVVFEIRGFAFAHD